MRKKPQVIYELRAYRYLQNEEMPIMVIYESDSYEDAMAELEIAVIDENTPQINLYMDDGERCEKLAVKDEYGINTDDF